MKPEQELEIVQDAVSLALLIPGKSTPVHFKILVSLNFLLVSFQIHFTKNQTYLVLTTTC